MLLNRCLECKRCYQVKDNDNFRPLDYGKESTRLAEELELECHCAPESGLYRGVFLDLEAVQLLATQATILRHLNLFQLSFALPAAELYFARQLGPRTETLVLGPIDGQHAPFGTNYSTFLAKFTSLKCLALLPSSTHHLVQDVSPPHRLPPTLVDLRLMACRLDIDPELVRYVNDFCPSLRALSTRVGKFIDAQCFNHLCRQLSRYKLLLWDVFTLRPTTGFQARAPLLQLHTKPLVG